MSSITTVLFQFFPPNSLGCFAWFCISFRNQIKL